MDINKVLNKIDEKCEKAKIKDDDSETILKIRAIKAQNAKTAKAKKK